MRERRGRGSGLLGVIALGLLLAACVGGIAGALPVWAALLVGGAGVLLVLFGVSRVVAQREPARAAAAAFMDELVAGRLSPDAYPRHDAAVNDGGTLVIRGLTDEGRQVSEYRVLGATIIGPGRLRAEITGWARLSTSEVVPIRLLMSQQADAGWRVIAVSAGSAR